MIRLFRSILFVPGTRTDRFAKAVSAGADAVIFDLEDAVDASRKAEAREAVATYLESASGSPVQLFVRVNAPGSPWVDDDLARVRDLAVVGAIVLPKVESPRQIEAIASRTASRRVIPLIESARAVLNAASIAAADVDVPALLFGAEDLTADLGIPRTTDGEELLFARSQIVLAAAAAGSEAIDAVFTHLADDDGLRADATRARALGFRGKMAIHPAQVPAINEVYSPSADEIARARETVAAFEAAGPAGVIRADDRMIEAPVVLRARRVLALAEAIAGR